MIREGLWLMVIGMTGVLVFLLLMVGLLQASGRLWALLELWLPEPASPSARSSPGDAAKSSVADDEALAVALAVAAAARKGGRA